MAEQNMSEVIEEVKNASEDELKQVIEGWYERTLMDGMHHGAYFISSAVMGAIDKNLRNGMNSSHRDFERTIKRIYEIVSVQLKQQETVQNDLKTEEVTDDRTAE